MPVSYVSLAPSSSGLGRRPLKAVAPVQIRSGLHVKQQVSGPITKLVIGPLTCGGCLGGAVMTLLSSLTRGARRPA